MQRKHLLLNPIALLLAISFLYCSSPTPEGTKTNGYLVIIGGGKRAESLMNRFIELADGFNRGKIVIFPMASAEPKETGQFQAEQLRELGAKDVSYFIISREQADSDSVVSLLDGVIGIFFSGGVQTRLTETIGGSATVKKIRQLYQDGAVIAGTSAGAAVMSEIMITGDEKRPETHRDMAFSRIERDNIITEKGFGFQKDVIFDQHFVRRKRHNRLISVVLENPQLVGVGIDESTAVIVHPDHTYEIIGDNSVVFYDARKAHISPANSTKNYSLAAANIKMHVLTQGYKFNMLTNQIE
ncbi:MAG: cyanophycinase, partial [bacterium]|nr:cyanophycinase [bacterium]